MKTIFAVLLTLFIGFESQAQQTIKGSFRSKENPDIVYSLMDGYFVETKFNASTKTFEYTWGGPYTTDGYKLLTGTRFQWFAINIETGEFSGTGGGTYQFINGKYTENIEFFSRDSSRVGASLQFSAKIEEGKWHHSGLSSKGDPIYEIWTRD